MWLQTQTNEHVFIIIVTSCRRHHHQPDAAAASSICHNSTQRVALVPAYACVGDALSVPAAAQHITHHTSHVTHHTSHITRHTSHITRHNSHVTHHTSHVTRHTSHVTQHASCVSRYVHCSALPVAYNEFPTAEWTPFATSVLQVCHVMCDLFTQRKCVTCTDKIALQAAYEATFAVAANLSQQRANSRVCHVTLFVPYHVTYLAGICVFDAFGGRCVRQQRRVDLRRCWLTCSNRVKSFVLCVMCTLTCLRSAAIGAAAQKYKDYPIDVKMVNYRP